MTSDSSNKSKISEASAVISEIETVQENLPTARASVEYEITEPDFLNVKDSPSKTKIDLSGKKGHRARLRDKVLLSGTNALADYELLEMLLFAASPRGDTKPLSKSLLAEFKTLGGVMSASNEQLKKIGNIGDAAIATIRIAETLGERLLKDKIVKRNVLTSWQALLEYCQGVMGRKEIEHFRILFLNNKNHLIADEVQQTGTVNQAAVYPREVIKRALELGATSIILVHNHPSGDTTPSKDDIRITEEIIKAADALSISVHDHLVVSANESTSLKSLGLM